MESNSARHECFNELIDQDTRSWDKQKIFKIFLPFKAEHICNIPIVRRIHEDMLYWPWEKNHNYSIRSAYHLQNKKVNLLTRYSEVVSHWKWLWNLNMPPKVRLFLWKLCLNGIPTKSCLIEKGFNTNPACYLCGETEESATHMFLECNWAKWGWFLSPLGFNSQFKERRLIGDWLMERARKESRDTLNIIASVLWSIWATRNDFYFKGRELNFLAASRRALFVGSEYRIACQVEKNPSLAPRSWSPPPV